MLAVLPGAINFFYPNLGTHLIQVRTLVSHVAARLILETD